MRSTTSRTGPSDAPILLLCTARPEFLDSRPAWGAGKQRASALTLPPLAADASTQLIANLLGGGRLPADAADRVADAGGGNPLFVEQMVSMLIDDGLVVRDDGGRDAGWTPVADLSSIAVPPSVAALLAARLERLSDEERRAIGSASVIGKVFYVGAVRELLPEPDRANAGPLVRSLVRKELVRETRSTIPGEDAFEFRHILIRDAAYAAIPKERRAEQHRRFADWCVRIAGERIEELEEIVGYHLEQAFRNRESIGALDEEARALAIEASARLESAGMRAFDRPDMSAAANLLRRAETLLPPDDPGRVVILTTLATALFDIGRLDEARDTIAEAEARAAVVGDPVAVEHATIASWWFIERGVEQHEQMRTDASRAIAVFEAAGDQRGLVRAWNLLTSIEWVLGQGGAQLDAVERALEHARGGTARYEEHEALGNLTAALVRGPTPVSEGIARAERTIEAYSGSREVDALMCHALAHLRARLGEFDAAREAMDRYRSFYRDTGQTLSYLRSAEVAFDLAMLAGEAEHACDVVEEASRSLAELGDSWPYLAAFLGQGRYAVGRYEDAREPAAFAAEHGDEVEGSLALGVLAKLAARSGDAPNGPGDHRRGRRPSGSHRLPVRPWHGARRPRGDDAAPRPRRRSGGGVRRGVEALRAEGRPRLLGAGPPPPRRGRAIRRSAPAETSLHQLVGREELGDLDAGQVRAELFARLPEEFAVNHGYDREDRRRYVTKVFGVADGGLGVLIPLDDDALGLVVVEVGVVLQRSGVLGPHDLHGLSGQPLELLELALVDLESSDTHKLTHDSSNHSRRSACSRRCRNDPQPSFPPVSDRSNAAAWTDLGARRRASSTADLVGVIESMRRVDVEPVIHRVGAALAVRSHTVPVRVAELVQELGG